MNNHHVAIPHHVRYVDVLICAALLSTAGLTSLDAGAAQARSAAASKFHAELRIAHSTLGETRIHVGDSVQGLIQPVCYDPATGKPVSDTVTFSVTGAPSTGGATSTFSPNPAPTFQWMQLTIVTTEQTAPGSYAMVVNGQGTVCGQYTPINEALDVAPLISGGDTLWWFNGQSPSGYKLSTTLRATPANLPNYQWNITAGSAKLAFRNGGASIATTTASTVVHSTGPNGSAATGDITVTVTVNGVASDPATLTVKAPNSLRLLRFVDEVDPVYGYASEIHYAILDQFGRVLPSLVPLNEQFTSSVVADYVGNDWRRGPEGGNAEYPSDWYDLVTGEGSMMTPTPLAPQSPLGHVKVDHWAGQWQIGSASIGLGRRVQTNTWQKFQDHARHTQIVTPAP